MRRRCRQSFLNGKSSATSPIRSHGPIRPTGRSPFAATLPSPPWNAATHGTGPSGLSLIPSASSAASASRVETPIGASGSIRLTSAGDSCSKPAAASPISGSASSKCRYSAYPRLLITQARAAFPKNRACAWSPSEIAITSPAACLRKSGRSPAKNGWRAGQK